MHVAIAGNIGSGKTTLAGLLAKQYGWEAYYEDVDKNPYLDDFYQDMERWSFNLQIYFLKSRFAKIMEIRESNKNVVEDRTIYEDATIFAPNLHDMGLMSERDFKNYTNLFKLMETMIRPPDLLIYLRSSVPTLVSRIQKRGRECEGTIRIDYLKNLNSRYEKWIAGYKEGKLLIIDANNVDFLQNPADLNKIVDKVEANIHGLF